MRNLAIVWVGTAVLVGMVVGAFFAGQLFALGCSETSHPDESTELCDAIGQAFTFGWWVAVLWPAALLVGSLLVLKVRQRRVVAGGVIAILEIGFWTYLLLYVTSNL